MVPADDDHKDTPEVDSSASTKERKSGRLTTMPDYLMHWWTPVLFAIILLAAGCFLASIWRMPLRPVSWQTVNPFWPPSWPFNYHWPSKDAMALCATIAGAGFAFSAWQQRSHDNAVRDDDKLDRERAATQARAEREEQRGLEETRRLKQIERDEYWKRREQIYQLLGSENPGLRLSAVALLAELADSAAHSTLLNETEKQQLQRHIIDTLCLQVRHEGLAHETEGSLEEHASIQENIFNQLVKRIYNRELHSPQADWRAYDIDLSHTIFHFPITLTNLEVKQNFDISHSRFLESFTIRESRLFNLKWPHSTFESSVQITGSELYIDQFPLEIRDGKFETTVLNTHQTNPILLTLTTPKDDFNATNIMRFTDNCKFPKGLHIQTNGSFGHQSSEDIEFTNSSFQSISICGRNFNAIIHFSHCKFFETTHIHDIDYQLGSAFSINQKEVGAYLSKISEGRSTVVDWEDAFPAYPYDQTAGISFYSCNFSTVEPNNMILAHDIQAFHEMYHCFDNPLITFEDNTTDNGERVELSIKYE
jgi:hypothetical protein